MKYIKGCRIRQVADGYAVRNTVFKHDYNAQLYVYYLRIVLLNGGKVHYVRDFDHAVAEIFQVENRTDATGLQPGGSGARGSAMKVNTFMFPPACMRFLIWNNNIFIM